MAVTHPAEERFVYEFTWLKVLLPANSGTFLPFLHFIVDPVSLDYYHFTGNKLAVSFSLIHSISSSVQRCWHWFCIFLMLSWGLSLISSYFTPSFFILIWNVISSLCWDLLFCKSSWAVLNPLISDIDMWSRYIFNNITVYWNMFDPSTLMGMWGRRQDITKEITGYWVLCHLSFCSKVIWLFSQFCVHLWPPVCFHCDGSST